MTSAIACAALALAMVLGPATADAEDPNHLSPKEQALLEQGQAAYEKQDFKAAAAAFERGYEVDGTPLFLYTWAQATRYAGDCASAIQLYDRYLVTELSEEQREATLKYRSKCDPTGAPPSPPGPAKAEPDPPPTPPSIVPAPSDEATPRVPAGAIALLTTGAVGTAIGVGLIIVGSRAATEQRDVILYQSFRNLERTKRRFLGAGVPIVTIGVGVLVVGVVRLARHRKTSRSTNEHRSSPGDHAWVPARRLHGGFQTWRTW